MKNTWEVWEPHLRSKNIGLKVWKLTLFREKPNWEVILNTSKITNFENALNSEKAYLLPCPASMMELFSSNSSKLLVVNNFRKKLHRKC